MGAKVRADRRNQNTEPLVAVESGGHPPPCGAPESAPRHPAIAIPGADPELEADVRATAAWFEALPFELQRYLDHEALHGRGAYTRFVDVAPKPSTT
jgi:hypothetical protein